MAAMQQSLGVSALVQSGSDDTRCTLTSRLRALKSSAAGLMSKISCLWRKLSFTWDLDFSNLPTADYTLLPTPQSQETTMSETEPSLLESFFAYKSKEKSRKTPIFALEWENAWRKRSKDQILLVIKRDKSQPAITEPSHSFYYLLTLRKVGKVLVAEVLYTDDRATGYLIDREVFSESPNLRQLMLRHRSKKYPSGKKLTLRVDKPATCDIV